MSEALECSRSAAAQPPRIPERQLAAAALLKLLLLLFAFPLHATLTSSAITGRVTAGDGPAAGVTVTATSAVLQHPRTTVTGPRGTYWLGALPPGQYDVTFAKAGMTTLTRRAVAEAGRVARADGRLEPSADEESVTSTATQVSVADTTAVTSHFDDGTLDRFPGRDYAGAIAPDAWSPSSVEIDGAPAFTIAPSEVLEQITVVRGAAPVESESYGGRLAVVSTRSGREDFFLSLRDTVSHDDWNEGGPFLGRGEGLQNFFEANGGGRILPRRLWFFAALWSGGDATRFRDDDRGVHAKLNAQAGAAHHLDAIYTDGRDAWQASLRHTGVYGARLASDTIVSRASTPFGFPPQPAPGGPHLPRQDVDFAATRLSYFVPAAYGDHVLTAGGSASDTGNFDTQALFLNNRWSTSRWVVNAGLRYEDVLLRNDLLPRIAVTFDPRGDGTRAIAASFGEYGYGSSSAPPVRIAALGYAAAIGSSGTARVDVLRHDGGITPATHSLQLDTRYRLFDRFEAGATYTYTRIEGGDAQLANAWIGAQFPVGAHEFGVTLLQRYSELFQVFNPGTHRHSYHPTDLALRYAVPLSRAGLMFAADAANVFNSGSWASPRTVRLWARVRL